MHTVQSYFITTVHRFVAYSVLTIMTVNVMAGWRSPCELSLNSVT